MHYFSSYLSMHDVHIFFEKCHNVLINAYMHKRVIETRYSSRSFFLMNVFHAFSEAGSFIKGVQ